VKKYPVAKSYLGKAEIAIVTKVIKSGSLSRRLYGPLFEKKFAKKIGIKYACAVSSGTAGLHLVMLAAGIKAGDEVITSTFSYIASANSIVYVGARPVFVDIDPLTYNLDPQEIEKKITKRTKAILVVHIFGQSADMAPIIKIAAKHHLKIIEDACESIMATCQGKKVGTFGEAGVFAFYPNKQMTTGEGGMIVTNNKKIYKLCVSLRGQGLVGGAKPFDYRYLGYNYRLNEMSAAMGVVQLNKLNFAIKERQKIANWYNKYLRSYQDLIQPPRVMMGNRHSWFVYTVTIKSKKNNRTKIIEVLSKKGIGTKPYFSPIHQFKFYRDRFGYRPGDFPVSEEAGCSSLALPLYIGLKEKDIEHIVKNLVSVIR